MSRRAHRETPRRPAWPIGASCGRLGPFLDGYRLPDGSRDARWLYVTNRLAGSLSVIDFASRKVIRTWRIGGTPDMIAVSPDGTKLWISNRYGGTVSVVDAQTGRVIRIILVGGRPHGLAYFPEPGRLSLGHNGIYR